MPAEQIATNLALINWTLLTGLAVGSFAVVVLARLATPATKGYLAFTALCAAGFGLLAYLSDTGLPVMGSTSPVPGRPGVRRAAARSRSSPSSALALVTGVALARGRRGPSCRRSPGSSAGLAVIALGALTWGGGPLGARAARDPARRAGARRPAACSRR